MADDEIIALDRARAAAKQVERAAAQLSQFADRLGAAVEPADIAEYGALIAREAAAISERVAAFQALGLRASSIDATGPVSGRDEDGWD